MPGRCPSCAANTPRTLKGADAVVWGIPFDAAVSNRPGARFGPQAIRRASAIFDNDPQYPFQRDLFAKMAVIDYGDCLLDYGNHQKTPATIEREAAKILEVGRVPAVARRRPFRHLAAAEGACRQYTARWRWCSSTRIRTPGTTTASASTTAPSSARAVRDGVIDPDRSIQIGIRTHAPEDCGIKILYGHEVEDMRAADIANAIIERTGGMPDLHHLRHRLPRPGLCARHRHAGRRRPVHGQDPVGAAPARRARHRGADVVEVAPAYDHADITAIAGATVAMHISACWRSETRRRAAEQLQIKPAADGRLRPRHTALENQRISTDWHMKPKIFIDGEHGTTGLQIRSASPAAPTSSSCPSRPSGARPGAARADLLNAADIAILCLPDDAAREASRWSPTHGTRIIDASTAHRVADGWAYGFPEMDADQAGAIAAARYVANPGCWPQGPIALLRPLVKAGILPADYPVTMSGISGYTGGGKSDDRGLRGHRARTRRIPALRR